MGQSPDRRRRPAPHPERSEASRKAWRTAKETAAAEVIAAHSERDRLDLCAILEARTGQLPDHTMIDSILSHLDRAQLTIATFSLELEERASKLSRPMGLPFAVYLAQQLSTGATRPMKSHLVKVEPAPAGIQTRCKFCGEPYGHSFECWVTVDGEILSAAQLADVAKLSLEQFDAMFAKPIRHTPCPVCTAHSEGEPSDSHKSR